MAQPTSCEEQSTEFKQKGSQTHQESIQIKTKKQNQQVNSK